MNIKSRLKRLERFLKPKHRPGPAIVVEDPEDGSITLDGKTYETADDLPKGIYKPLIILSLGKHSSD